MTIASRLCGAVLLALVTVGCPDLGDDPMETNDLSAEHPERVAAMRTALEQWLGSVVDSLNGMDYERQAAR